LIKAGSGLKAGKIFPRSFQGRDKKISIALTFSNKKSMMIKLRFPDLILRPARPTDLPAIRRLVRQGRINPFGLHWARFWVVANSEDRVIACGQIKIHPAGTRELASIVVDPAERGRGLARILIEHLLAETRTEYRGTIYLTCRSSLGEMYEKFGFQRIKPSEMPPYLRLLSCLGNWLNKLKIIPESILVMHLTPEEIPPKHPLP
jgi:N-acetylglutamate synthase-like GNAT family acetyltransferase